MAFNLQLFGGRGSSGTRSSLPQKPIFNENNYKVSQEVKDVIEHVYSEMQKDFPVLNTPISFVFYKQYDALGRGFYNQIELRGPSLKSNLKNGRVYNIEDTVAHELTHIVQSRIFEKLDKGKLNRDAWEDKVFNSALTKYINNDKLLRTNKELATSSIKELLEKVYGGKEGSTGTEAIAVTVASVYNSELKNTRLGDIGRYVIKELQSNTKRKK